jgi:hypothetical protein
MKGDLKIIAVNNKITRKAKRFMACLLLRYLCIITESCNISLYCNNLLFLKEGRIHKLFDSFPFGLRPTTTTLLTSSLVT